MRLLICLATLLLCVTRLIAQDTVKAQKVNIFAIPTVTYAPETRLALGAFSLFTFNLYQDSLTRSSNARAEFRYTWNRQMIVETGWNFFPKGERFFTNGLVHYAKFVDLYYATGTNTPETNRLVYDSNRFMVEAYLLKRVKPRLFTGFNAKYINYWGVGSAERAPSYQELTDRSTVGIGYSLVKDSRNNLLSPIEGVYALANTTYSFSQENYVELLFDLRYYKTWQNKYTLASRLINDLTVGTPAFYDYAVLGGDKFVRGYYLGRYRDRNLSSLQAEFRFPVYWRFGVAVFGGVSALYPGLSGFRAQNSKFNGGVGLRFMVDKTERTNLRLDYAIGTEGNRGFYVAFGESF